MQGIAERGVNQVEVFEERGPICAGELRALIQVDQHLIFRLASPHRHEQRLQYDVGGLTALDCLANHSAGIEIDDDREVGESLDGPDIGDVRDPGRVGSRYVELPVERIVDNDGRRQPYLPGRRP